VTECRERTLPQARKDLEDAVNKLCAPQQRLFGDALHTAPSRYHQLTQELAGAQGESHVPPTSMPPLWLEATQLLADIDRQARRWEPAPRNTTERLTHIARRSWRPQDVDLVVTISTTVYRWSDNIDTLLYPDSVKSVSAACPACGATHVYRMKSGERVRQAALQIITNVGCTCHNCETHWGPELYQHLARVLGFDPLPGILE
jgi:hypothetical protein